LLHQEWNRSLQHFMKLDAWPVLAREGYTQLHSYRTAALMWASMHKLKVAQHAKGMYKYKDVLNLKSSGPMQISQLEKQTASPQTLI